MKNHRVLDLSMLFHVGLLAGSFLLFFFTKESPLLGSLGFESANLFVTLFGPLYCLAAALNKKLVQNSFNRTFLRESLWLCAHLTVYGGLLCINGFYKTSCSNGAGLASFLLIGVPPLLLAISIGTLVSALIRSTAMKLVVVILGFATYASWIAFSWWLEPSFRFLTHLSFIMSSDLLAGDSLNPGVVGFRCATILIALAIILFGSSFLSAAELKVFSKKTSRPFMGLAIIALTLAAACAVHYYSQKSLGYDHNDLVSHYQLLAHKNDIRIFAHPDKVRIQEAKAMLDEALLFQARIAARLGSISDQPITIWLHASNQDKFLYTGANNVHFALPKHREIHISGLDIPHDVLGHELAHIYVGEYSQSLLGTPGSLLIPNLALTEGLAMFLSKELTLDNDLTMLEQAQALHQIHIRPDIQQLFKSSIYFALFHPRASYIYAGAALEFLLTDIPPTEQPKKIQALIESGQLTTLFADEKALGKKLAELTQFLSQKAPPYALMWARKNFTTGSIIVNNCHNDQRPEKIRITRALLNHDLKVIATTLKTMNSDEQEKLLDHVIQSEQKNKNAPMVYQLLSIKESLATQQTVEEQLAFKLLKLDTLISLERFAEALKLTHEINAASLDTSDQRQLIAKQIFLRSYLHLGVPDPLSKTALFVLTAAATEQSARQFDFAYELGKSAHQLDSDSRRLATYLYARLLMRLERFKEALPTIIALMAHKEHLPHLFAHELLFMFALTQDQLQHYPEALLTYEALLTTATTPGEKLFTQDHLERIRFKQK